MVLRSSLVAETVRSMQLVYPSRIDVESYRRVELAELDRQGEAYIPESDNANSYVVQAVHAPSQTPLSRDARRRALQASGRPRAPATWPRDRGAIVMGELANAVIQVSLSLLIEYVAREAVKANPV